MSGEERSRPAPARFRLDDSARSSCRTPTPLRRPNSRSGGVVVAPTPDAFAPDGEPAEPQSDEQAVEIAQQRGVLKRALLSWGGLFWSALGGLVSLGFGLWTARIVDELFRPLDDAGVDRRRAGRCPAARNSRPAGAREPRDLPPEAHRAPARRPCGSARDGRPASPRAAASANSSRSTPTGRTRRDRETW